MRERSDIAVETTGIPRSFTLVVSYFLGKARNTWVVWPVAAGAERAHVASGCSRR
jgi:hypothetical protein